MSMPQSILSALSWIADCSLRICSSKTNFLVSAVLLIASKCKHRPVSGFSTKQDLFKLLLVSVLAKGSLRIMVMMQSLSFALRALCAARASSMGIFATTSPFMIRKSPARILRASRSRIASPTDALVDLRIWKERNGEWSDIHMDLVRYASIWS